jgi:hypothetical protein
MSEETLYEGIKQEMRGLKDPGNVLIVVYILLVFFLLLFAGLVSAQADLGKVDEGTFSIERKGELYVPAWDVSSRLDRSHHVHNGRPEK